MPISFSCIASKDALTFSPVESKASNSLFSGFFEMPLASLTNLSVSLPIAETTTTGNSFLKAALIMFATANIRSAEPTEVPPNF